MAVKQFTKPIHNGIDYTGKKLGSWTVLSIEDRDEHLHRKWKMQCACGLVAVRHKYNLFRGRGLQCAACYHTSIRGEKHYAWSGTGKVPGTYISQIQNGANARGISVEVSGEFLNSIFTGICSLSGVFISFEDHTASLDRIDSSIGYTETNVQWVHKDINLMKNHFNIDYFHSMCEKVTNINKKYDSLIHKN